MEVIASLENDLEAGRVSISDNDTVVTCPFCGIELPVESKTCPSCKKTLSDEM
jgi:rubrerythrin